MAEGKSGGALQQFWRGTGRVGWLRDIVFAGLAVIIVIGSIFAYSSTWPPMVVIESGSMMHANDRSMLGVIDTGDLTLVKKVDSRPGVVTYFEGLKTGYQTYGNYGDVIIYAKNGHKEITPIIHRALVWLELNSSTGAGLSPSAPKGVINSTWKIAELGLTIEVPSDSSTHMIVDLGAVRTWNGGTEHLANISIDMTLAVSGMGAHLHSGFITKGDHNQIQDEAVPPGSPASGLSGPAPRWPGEVVDPHAPTIVPVQPVLMEWVVGRAEGELPWFGVIKLWVGGTSLESIPGNSQANLLIAIFVIGAGPFIFEKVWGRYGENITRRIPQRTKDRWHGFWDKLPGGKGRIARRAELAEEREAAKRKRGGRRQGGKAR